MSTQPDNLPPGQRLTVAASDLRRGDYVIPASATVESVDVFAGFCIVDFTDSTAYGPIPGAYPVDIIRPAA